MRVIGEPFSSIETYAFVQAARDLLGVRWKHQGRSSNGVDCAGLVSYALRAVGRQVKDERCYSRHAYRGKLEMLLQMNFGNPLRSKEMLRVGDIPLFKFSDAPSHVGIIGDYIYGGHSLIHAHAPTRKVIEARLDDSWYGRIAEVYRP